MFKTIKCKVDNVPFNFLRRNEEINFSNRIEELARFITDGYARGVFYEVELPDGKIMSGNHSKIDDVFRDTFGCSVKEWRQQQRQSATVISVDDLFGNQKPQDVNAYYIKEALEKRNDNGENVCLEWNGRKCYSIDTVSVHDINFIENVTGLEEYEYKKSLMANAKYISSIGLPVEEIAKKMVDAHNSGLNVYTYVIIPEGVAIGLQKKPVVHSISIKDEECFYNEVLGINKKQYNRALQTKEQKEKEERQETLEKRQKIKSFKITPRPEIKDRAMPLSIDYNRFSEMAQDLLQRAQRGENVFTEFNGVRHYTCEISNIDDIFKKQFGITYEENNISEDKWMENYQKKAEEKLKNLPQKTQKLYEKGLPFIDPSVDESKWRYCVDVRCSDIYDGKDLENAIDIIESLSKGDFDKAADIFNDANHSASSSRAVLSIVEHFRPNDFGEFQNTLRDLEREEREL